MRMHLVGLSKDEIDLIYDAIDIFGFNVAENPTVDINFKKKVDRITSQIKRKMSYHQEKVKR